MKNRKRMILALICGVVAVAAMAFYVTSVQAQVKQGRAEALSAYGGEQVEVFVAMRDIAIGETLTSENVSRQLWLSDLLPAGALVDQDEVFGQSTIIPVMKNEPIISTKIGELKVPVTVPEDMCAVSIPSDDVLAVGGVIRSGAYVSIYAADGTDVELIADEVLVLDTSNELPRGSSSTSSLMTDSSSRARLTWVTLAVEPENVQELIAASTSEQLHLVLPGGVGNE